MARSTVLIVTPESTRALEVDSRLLAWLRPLLLGLGGASVVLALCLAALGVLHVAARADWRAAQQASQAELHALREASQQELLALRQEVADLKNFTSAEINTKLAALKKSEQMIGELQAYLQARGVHVKPVSMEPPQGQPNPAAGGPAPQDISAAHPVPYTGSFARDAGNLLQALQSVPLGLPHGGAITSRFGHRPNPFTGQGSELHGGLDFKGSVGEPVQATAGGRVSFAGTQSGYGQVVEVAHAHGYSTVYAHLSRIDVQKGQRIQPGDTLGLLGSSGRSTGPHLHYEVQLRGQRLDPESFLALGPVQ
ncbi:MAG: peptidoglycan DD-metalloendopeptidase family protein [Pseudomonadota bacterium]|nr:peptidoglycan DD-metalloendopeptidase family protein [Pseudomonadota bacterium]